MKYRCTLKYFDEEIIEADSPEEADSIFWENKEVCIEDYLYIKQFRKRSKPSQLTGRKE